MKSIHILHHSISPFEGQYPEDDPLHYNTGFPMLYGRAILNHFPNYEVEVWRPECTLNQDEYTWRDDTNILHRVFRSRHLRYKVEYSRPMMKASTELTTASDVEVWIHGIYNLHAYLLAHTLRSVPVIAQSHGGYPARALFGISDHKWKRVLYLPISLPETVSLPKFTHIFAISSEEKRYLADYMPIGPEHISLSPVGIDFDLFQPGDKAQARTSCGIPADRLMLLYVGRLSQEKGIEYLVEAFAEVVAKVDNIHLYVLGSGPLKQKLEVQVREAGLDSSIHFAGYVPYENVPDWYRAADLTVMPSLNEWFGMVAAEAMACGTPIVATKAGGAIDIVREFECGMLVPPRDSKALANALVRSVMQSAPKEPNVAKARAILGWSAKLNHASKIFEVQRDQLFSAAGGDR